MSPATIFQLIPTAKASSALETPIFPLPQQKYENQSLISKA